MIQRYEKAPGGWHYADSMTPEEMKWCKSSDVAKLEAENEHQLEQLYRLQTGKEIESDYIDELRLTKQILGDSHAEIEQLKAQLVRWKHGEKFISKRHEKLRVRAISREMYELRDERYSPLAGWTASRVDDVDLWFHRDHAAAIRQLCEEFEE